MVLCVSASLRIPNILASLASWRFLNGWPLETGAAGEGELFDAGGGDHGAAYEAFLEPEGAAELGVLPGFEDALVEPQVLDGPGDLAVLDQEGAVAGHAGEDGEQGVDHAQVVEAGDPDAALDALGELFFG